MGGLEPEPQTIVDVDVAAVYKPASGFSEVLDAHTVAGVGLVHRQYSLVRSGVQTLMARSLGFLSERSLRNRVEQGLGVAWR